jgi:hypothetical protein
MEEPGEAYWSLVEPFWDSVDIYEGPGRFLKDFTAVPARSGHLLAAHWCQSEVINGGFDQFFYNSTGVLAPEAAAGFEAVGMRNLGEVIQRAMSLFGPEFARDRDLRQEWLENQAAEASPFAELDDEFYDLIVVEQGGWDQAADRYALGETG